jgi:DNA mismatch repair ATPase MutS
MLLYLLAENHQGTNPAERLAASRRIIRHLVEEGAVGAVTTHDLALAEAEELRNAARPVHFRESFRSVDGRARMSFDYKLREGVATSTNALRLMALVGLDV